MEMDSGSSVRFGQDVATGPVHLGGGGAAAAAHQVMPGTGMTIPTGMGSLLLGTGGGYLAPAWYGGTVPANVVHAAWNGGVAVAGGQLQQQARAGGAVMRPPTVRGPWTEEEDETLKEMVNVYGERKWAAVSQHLPGRIGKQCRERWTNHLRSDIDKAKTIWTEKDDIDLIRAHKIHGNRWSMIARQLPGRSENAVKNHWNATKRSLKAKRRLKKKKNAEAPPGQQWSILEQYIRSLPPAVVTEDGGGAGAGSVPQQEPSDDSPPSSYNTGGGGYYGGEVVSPPLAPAAAGFEFDPASLGMCLSAAAAGNNDPSSAAAAVNLGAMNPDLLAPPPYLGLDLNSYYYHYGGEPLAAAAAPEMMMMEQEQQDSSYASNGDNLITYPFVDHMAWQSPSVHADDAYYDANNNANAGHYPYYYYGDTGPSGAGAGGDAAAIVPDDVDVVQMASREFQMNPSEDEVTLNLAGFM